MKLISGTCHPSLSKSLSKKLKVPLTPVEIKTFADGEIYVRVKEKVR